MTRFMSLLAATAPAGLDGERAPVPLGYEAANTLPDAIQVLLIVLAAVVIIALIIVIIWTITNHSGSYGNSNLYRRMRQDHSYLQSNLFNATSDILHETIKHSRR